MRDKIVRIVKTNIILNNIGRRAIRIFSKFKKSIIGKNNKIFNKGVLINVKYDIIGDNNFIEIQDQAVLIDVLIYIRGDDNHVRIGKYCKLRGGAMWFENKGGLLDLGDKTSVESAHFAITESNKKIIIGKDCMLSGAIEMRTGDSHSIIDLDTNRRINHAKNIHIGNHVWIGTQSKILKGVKIEDDCVIGAYSVVTKDILKNSIAVGVPAKIVKSNVNWLRERIN